MSNQFPVMLMLMPQDHTLRTTGPSNGSQNLDMGSQNLSMHTNHLGSLLEMQPQLPPMMYVQMHRGDADVEGAPFPIAEKLIGQFPRALFDMHI